MATLAFVLGRCRTSEQSASLSRDWASGEAASALIAERIIQPFDSSIFGSLVNMRTGLCNPTAGGAAQAPRSGCSITNEIAWSAGTWNRPIGYIISFHF